VLESHSHALTKRLERPACELSAIVIQDELRPNLKYVCSLQWVLSFVIIIWKCCNVYKNVILHTL